MSELLSNEKYKIAQHSNIKEMIDQIKKQFNILKYSNLNLESLNSIKTMMIHRMHESWKKFRLVDRNKDTHFARWKETYGPKFINQIFLGEIIILL